jgi:hypothetical protein
MSLRRIVQGRQHGSCRSELRQLRQHLLTRGATSFSSSSHLPAIVDPIVLKPVTLPPGRGMLATKPLPTGSATFAKMMGMVRVCRIIATVVGVFCVRTRSGPSATSSFANRCLVSASAAAQRKSIRMLRSSVHPKGSDNAPNSR